MESGKGYRNNEPMLSFQLKFNFLLYIYISALNLHFLSQQYFAVCGLLIYRF